MLGRESLTLRLKSLGHPPDELTICFSCGCLDLLLCRMAVAICDVGRYCPCEQDRVLG